MLGGGNPVSGSNPAGVGTTLNYVGDHAYAYSGVIGVTDSETTMLEFQLGNSYVVGTLQISFLEISSIDINYRIYINNEVVQGYLAYETAGASEPDNSIPILIPPFATCKITGTAASSANLDNVVSLIGRVYS